MSTQENLTKLRELEKKYPDKVKVLHSKTEIEELLDLDAVRKAGTSGMSHFKNDDSAWPDFISKQLVSGKDVAISAAGKHSIFVIVGNGLFKK